MPPVELCAPGQLAIYWEFAGVDGYGNPNFYSGIELKVRWDYERREATSPEGQTVRTEVTIVANRVITIKSVLWLPPNPFGLKTGGALLQLPSDLNTITKYQALTYAPVLDVKSRNQYREVLCSRFMNKMFPIVGTGS